MSRAGVLTAPIYRVLLPKSAWAGTKALVLGFEEGIGDVRPGAKRRIIIPPEIGPLVGPSTFFSSKQFEVLEVAHLMIHSVCNKLQAVSRYKFGPFPTFNYSTSSVSELGSA
ncbi:hypothetical protein Q3G72_012056 [Acer saccharum]|nr:hypothetical protein Q3G72_012056 [Acer saccharum]